VNSGEISPPIKKEPPLLGALSLNDSLGDPTTGHGVRPLYSQSLPNTGGLASFGGLYPAKPRVRPSLSTSNPPILELPEPSPHSSSLLSAYGHEGGIPEEALGEESGGMSMLDPPRRHQNFQYAASAPATMLWGSSGHRIGTSGLGGRTPSKTLLEAMTTMAPT